MNEINENRVYVPKGWGYEDWIVNTPLYCGKDLFLKKGKRLSLHYHALKDETFYIQSGEVELRYYLNPDVDKNFKSWEDFDHILCYPLYGICSPTLVAGDSFHIPVGMRHTLTGLMDSHIFEFSTQHFDSDSIRVLKGD